MPQPLQDQTRRTKTKWALSLLALALLVGAVAMLLPWGLAPKTPVKSTATTPLAISRTNLVFVGGRLCLSGQTNAFTGIMIDHQADGSLRSRSAVTDGLLHGLSEGWHTNGQLQVTEHFKAGVSHGLRTKWYADGTRLSAAAIVDGRLHGPFRRWHENGAPAEEMEMNNGQPDGIAKAYFANGNLKSECTLQSGKIVEQKFWENDGSKATISVTGLQILTHGQSARRQPDE
jgi:antitoxin component YwqK of YwqJK toxin-antitoxin module